MAATHEGRLRGTFRAAQARSDTPRSQAIKHRAVVRHSQNRRLRMVGPLLLLKSGHLLRHSALHIAGAVTGEQLRQAGGYLGVGSDDVRVPDRPHPLQDPARKQPPLNRTACPTKVNSTIVYPKFLSEDCLSLMRMILEKDPSSRIGILDIL